MRALVTRAGFAAVLVTLCLVAVVNVASARSGSIAFADAQHGWLLTLEGSSYEPFAMGTAVEWRTLDGGTTWQRLAALKPTFTGDGSIFAGTIAFVSANKGVWGRTGSRLLRTTDGGSSWKRSSRKFAAVGILNDLSYASRTAVWACGMYGSDEEGGAIVRSTDGGATWRVSKRVVGHPWTGGFFQISSPTSRRCYVAGGGTHLGGLWVTRDYGSHWVKRRLPDQGVGILDFPTALTGWYSGGSGVLYKTTNGGRTWRVQTVLAERALHASGASFVDASHGWICGESGVIVRTVDGGANWQWLNSGTDALMTNVVFVDRTHGWASGIGGDYPDTWDVLLRTVNGGLTWKRL